MIRKEEAGQNPEEGQGVSGQKPGRQGRSGGRGAGAAGSRYFKRGAR